MAKHLITLFLFSFYINGAAQLNEIDNPVKNFDYLWNQFNNRYANFELKQVNWDAMYQTYRPQISDTTSNKTLLKVCCQMLQELKDGHVSIEADFDEDNYVCGPPYEFTIDTEFNTNEKYQAFEEVVNKELAANGFSKPTKIELNEDTNFQYRTSEQYGYLRLDEITEMLTFGKYMRAVDEAIAEFQNKKGMLLDLRFNGGGWDYNAYRLASRLIAKGKSAGHYERKRIKGKNLYTNYKYRKIKGKGKHQFTKPIVILTSDFTASAAEVFLLVVKDLPYVTLIGDHTEGIFSDMFEFKLPNKWQISLSHQQYFSADNVNYEGKGIPPDIEVVNDKSNLDSQTDPVIQRAIRYLTQIIH